MRTIISLSAGVFVVLGAVVAVVGGFMWLAIAFNTGTLGGGAMAGLQVMVAIGGGALCVLVGGGTWLLASIDARLEKMQARAGAAPSKPASASRMY